MICSRFEDLGRCGGGLWGDDVWHLDSLEPPSLCNSASQPLSSQLLVNMDKSPNPKPGP